MEITELERETLNTIARVMAPVLTKEQAAEIAVNLEYESIKLSQTVKTEIEIREAVRIMILSGLIFSMDKESLPSSNKEQKT